MIAEMLANFSANTYGPGTVPREAPRVPRDAPRARRASLSVTSNARRVSANVCSGEPSLCSVDDAPQGTNRGRIRPFTFDRGGE